MTQSPRYTFTRPITILLLIPSLLYVFASRTHAAVLSVSPPVTEIILAPNTKTTQTFTLKTTGENLKITPKLHLFKPADQYGHAQIDSTELDQTSIPLLVDISGPPSTPTLTFEATAITSPTDIYLALVFSAENESNSSRLTSAVAGISALILVTINPAGSTPINLTIQDFDPPSIHDPWTTFTIYPTLKNNTDIMIRPTGIYQIQNPSGQTIHTLPLNPGLILGNSTRIIETDLFSTLSWSPNWYNFGPHKIILTINSLGGSPLIQSEKVVWFIPIRLIIVLVLSILLTLFVSSKFKSRKIQKTSD